MRLLILLSSFLTFHALAVDLPQIQKPLELESGEFAEGTMTSLSAEQIKEFLPWANNAKKQLSDSLLEAKRNSLQERIVILQRDVKRVVKDSAPKKYQMLMRYALNRGLLMVDFLDKEADSKQIGIIQNQLDILIKSIHASFEFYESDLEFQKRSGKENPLSLSQAELGVKLSKIFFKSAEGIMDASAQYLVMKKTFEILAWDLSQDKKAKEYAEQIVEIHNKISAMPAKADGDEAIKHIRSMIALKNKVVNTFFVISGPTPILATPSDKVYEMSNEKTTAAAVTPIAVYPKKIAGLFWTQENLGITDYESATAACANLKLEGKSWRLPTKEEYESAEKNKILEKLVFYGKFWWTSDELKPSCTNGNWRARLALSCNRGWGFRSIPAFVGNDGRPFVSFRCVAK